MIISRTPFRVSFFGGGTDLPAFYQEEPGAVLSTTINQYMYLTVHTLSPLYEHRIRLSYSKTELVKSIQQLHHPAAKAALQLLQIDEPIEITAIADIPAKTGLGSSSSFVVGLLHALHAYQSEYVSPEQLARQACHVEIDLLSEPIGRQDQYAAAYGGLRYYQFQPDHSVHTTPVLCSREVIDILKGSLMMFYTGGSRSAAEILSRQSKQTKEKQPTLRRMRELCTEALAVLANGKNLNVFGELLHEGWKLKRTLTEGITNEHIDNIYEQARRAGAIGGKLLGAGGAGFLLLFVEEEKQRQVRKQLQDLIELPFDFDYEGSTIIYYNDWEKR